VDLHLARLQRSAERLAIPLPPGWPELVALVTSAYGNAAGVLRLTCSKGPPGGHPVGFALAARSRLQPCKAGSTG
jgi:branched-subunit amino acid aminotransferase/4-amino-4-deoxychorismate lyase